MRYRAQDTNGDYQFGQPNIFLVDSAAAVAQAIKTRLLLMTNEWFLDEREGTPYIPDILGYGTYSTRDIAIRSRILGTPGVTEIIKYSSDVEARRFTVEVTVMTSYSETATVSVNF